MTTVKQASINNHMKNGTLQRCNTLGPQKCPSIYLRSFQSLDNQSPKHRDAMVAEVIYKSFVMLDRHTFLGTFSSIADKNSSFFMCLRLPDKFIMLVSCSWWKSRFPDQ